VLAIVITLAGSVAFLFAAGGAVPAYHAAIGGRIATFPGAMPHHRASVAAPIETQ